MATETMTFKDDITPLDLILFRRYGQDVPGLVEQTFSNNYGLSTLGYFPPHGTTIVVTSPSPVSRSTTARTIVRLYD